MVEVGSVIKRNGKRQVSVLARRIRALSSVEYDYRISEYTDNGERSDVPLESFQERELNNLMNFNSLIQK